MLHPPFRQNFKLYNLLLVIITCHGSYKISVNQKCLVVVSIVKLVRMKTDLIMIFAM